jgi:hypothetical protein
MSYSLQHSVVKKGPSIAPFARQGTPMISLYHRTYDAVAEIILRDGFRDGAGTYMTTEEHSGVWLSNVPLDGNEGAKGDALLRLELPEKDITDFEWIEDGKPYREWLIPAALVNEKASGLCAVSGSELSEPLRLLCWKPPH